MKRVLARLGLVVFGLLLACVVLIGAEIGLRLGGVGEGPPAYDPFSGFSAAIPLFEPAEGPDGVAIYRVSPARLAGKQVPLGESERRFLAQKPPGGFRVFVVGGSTAAGFPYGPSYAFSRWLKRRLESSLPGAPVEVVNAALSGYSSRRVLIVVKEIAQYEPDLVVVYSGHNEWAERRYYSRLIEMDPRLFSLRERLFDTRLFVLLSRLAVPPQASLDEAIDRYVKDERREFIEMFAVFSRRVQGEDYASEAEVEQRDHLFRANLEAIVRAVRSAGATPLLLTLSQNFADWSPGASVHRPGLGDLDRRRFDALVDEGNRAAEAADCRSALTSYKAALAIDDEFADLHYRLAECHRTLGDTAAARVHYRRASDLDQVPHGAPTHFNDVIREIAREQALPMVDVDALLTEESNDGLVGNDLFVEFAHPNLRAHQRIGAAIAETLREAGIPRAPGVWHNSGYVDPDPASLYEADPELRAREHQSWKVVCALARRPECVEEHTRALLEPRRTASKAGAP